MGVGISVAADIANAYLQFRKDFDPILKGMPVTVKIDLISALQRGLAVFLNETAPYMLVNKETWLILGFGVAFGLITGLGYRVAESRSKKT